MKKERMVVGRMIPDGPNSLAARLPSLTGIRGIAALWVVLYHSFQDGVRPIPIIGSGYAGVDLFFILSGFVLSHVYSADRQLVSPAGYMSFLCARLARIYPLHLFALCCLGGIVIGLPGFPDAYTDPQNRFSGGAFVASLFLVQNWGGWHPGNWNGPAWSLSAEWFAYLIFPLLLTAIQPVRSRAVLIGAAICALGATMMALHGAGYTSTAAGGRAGMVRMAGEFTTGCLVYAAFQRGWRVPVLAGQCAAALLFVVGTFADRAEFGLLFSFTLLIALAAQENSITSFLLRQRPCVFLGEISFSIYLMHWIILQVFNWLGRNNGPFTPIAEVAIRFLVIGVVSYATYTWIERPARLWGRRLATRAWERGARSNPAFTPSRIPDISS